MNKTEIEVLILAGGFGTRLRSVVSDLPKPMVHVANYPFVEFVLKYLKEQGFTHFCFLTGFMSEKVESYFKDGAHLDVSIRYSVEESPLGTGGSVKKAIQSSSKNFFLIVNGDTLFLFNTEDLLSTSKVFSMALCRVPDVSRYGEVILENGIVTYFKEKSEELRGGDINSGIYFTSRKIIDFMPSMEAFSLEKDVFPRLVTQCEIQGVQAEVPFLDIGVPEDFYRAPSFIKQHLQRFV